MNIADIPFHRLIGLQCEPAGGEFSVSLPAGEQYQNHLGTLHAGAQLSLAEAACGEYLMKNFHALAGVFAPVVRRVEAKFLRPARGKVLARVLVADEERREFEAGLPTKRHLALTLRAEVFDASGVRSLTANFEWLFSRLDCDLI